MVEGFEPDWKLFEFGRCYTLKNRYRTGANHFTDMFLVILKLPQYSSVFVHDPNNFYLSKKVNQIPGIEYRNSENNTWNVQTIKLIKRNKRNTQSSSCNKDPNYSLSVCLENFVEKKVGCSLPWTGDLRMRKCDNITEYKQHFDEYEKISSDEFSQITRYTACLAPCSYIDVVPHGNPVVTRGQKSAAYFLTLAETRIQVMTERQHPDFSSLVADIGGTLGLFLGFSFYMVWDLITMIMLKFKKYSTSTE